MTTLSDGWQLGGLAALLAAAALITWFFRMEGQESANERHTQARIQRGILAGQIVPVSAAPLSAPLSAPPRLVAEDEGREDDGHSDRPGDAERRARVLRSVAERVRTGQLVYREEPDGAAVELAEPGDWEDDGPQAETYCPACVCVALENHQGYAPEDWQQDVFVPLGAVVTRGMLDGSARAWFCGHHLRLHDRMAARDAWAIRFGLDAYVRRLAARVRLGHADSGADFPSDVPPDDPSRDENGENSGRVA
jgi:hypothetical protein